MDQLPSATVRLLDRILATISSIRYGVVEIVIHNGQVVQIAKTEKIRVLDANQSSGGSHRSS